MVVRLALEEMGQPFETRLVDRAAREHEGAAYRAINPAGLIPALETPHGAIFETGAILLWLADTHGSMAPSPADRERGDFLKWLFFTANTLHSGLRMTFYPARYAGAQKAAQTSLRETMQAALASHLRLLDRAMAETPALTRERPSVLDCYVACCLRWCALYPMGATCWFALSDYPTLAGRLEAFESRPSVRRLQEAEGLGPTPFTAPHLPDPPEGSAT